MAIAFVQQKAEQSTSSVASFTTSAMTVSSANAIVACTCGSVSTLTSLVVSDSAGDAYSLAVFKAATPGLGGSVSIYSAPVLAGGSTTFTVTPNVNAFVSISAQEYSGMVTSSPGEATNNGTGTSTTTSPGAVNPATANDLYVACWSHNGSTSQTFPTNPSGEGWNLRSNLTNTTNQPLGSQDLVSSGSKTGNRTISASASWVSIVATFKAAAASTVFGWMYQRPDTLVNRTKLDVVPSGQMPGRGI
jgi:hypothetical protein